MQFTTVALFLFATIGAVATPVESEFNSLDARAEASANIKYDGTCTRSKNECKYKGQNGNSAFIKCPTFANKKCTKDGAKCTYDSVDKKVTCD